LLVIRPAGFAAAQLAHGAVGDVLGRAARLRGGVIGLKYFGQGLRQRGAGAHPGQAAGRTEQGEGERIALQRRTVVELGRGLDFVALAQARGFARRRRGLRRGCGTAEGAARLAPERLRGPGSLPALGRGPRRAGLVLARTRGASAGGGLGIGLGFDGERRALFSHGESGYA
jgi:hypothetical protein